MKWTTSLAAALCAALAAGVSHAAIVNSVSFNSTTGIGGITSWPTPFNTTSNANPSQMNTAEGNYGSASLFSLGQSFVATATGNLKSVEIAITGTGPKSFDVALYEAGANDVTDITTGTYTPGSGGYTNNLLSDVAQTWTAYTLPGANAAVLKFSMSGADMAPIVAGKSYIFEISSTSNPNPGSPNPSVLWFRNGQDPANYLDGQAFRQRSPLNGNARRDLAIAIAVTPEPSSAVLACMGASLVGLLRRRR